MSKKISTRTKFNRAKARSADSVVRTGVFITVFTVAGGIFVPLGVPLISVFGGAGAAYCFREGEAHGKPPVGIELVKISDDKYVRYNSDVHKKTDLVSYQGSESQYGALRGSFRKTAKLQTKLEAAKTDRQRKRLQKKIDKKIRFQNDVISGLKRVK